jgi:alginate O-acetyltransferase complex protein AlgI
VLPVLRAGYDLLAANRHCLNGACAVRRRAGWLDWLPLALFPLAALAARNAVADWVFMWLLAFGIFCGCKWLTWRRAFATNPRPAHWRSFAYLVAWPGMDAHEFLAGKPASRPHVQDWIFASAKTLAGIGLLLVAATDGLVTAPLLGAWLGMVGVVLLLHFGLFHVLALTWQRAGLAAKPVMRAPLLATSLGEFWGHRWNTAFNTLAHDLAFRPVARRVGIKWSTLAVFFLSGLVHDLVISVPARGGYGLPTAYFLLQGAAVLFERSYAGRALGLGRGSRGWVFMFVVTAAPLFWLFHPPFIHNVILPMIQTIGSTLNST